MIPAKYPLIVLGIVCACWFAVWVAPYLKRCRSVIFWAAVAVLTVFAGTKHQTGPIYKFTYRNGVTDNGSYCTNDLIHAKWNYYAAYADYVFRWCYRDLTVTNSAGECTDEYHYLPDSMVLEMEAEATVPNATNMQVLCYAQYVPPTYVVTNGVYHMTGVMRSIATTNSPAPVFVTPGIPVKADLEGAFLTTTNRPPAL